MSWDANRNNICYRQYVGTRRWGGVAAYCITILETEVKILDIELQVRKNELSRWRRVVGAGRKSQLPHRERDRRGYSTSSRIFFHIIRVISSPSSSTTGFFTTIFSPKMRIKDGTKARNVDNEISTRTETTTHGTTACYWQNHAKRQSLRIG